MLYEWDGIRQRPEEGHRTWYTDEAMDLIVWREHTDGPATGFQLCYDKDTQEKALSWYADGRVTHTRIDAGESRPGTFKGSPVLADDVTLDGRALARQFRDRSQQLDTEVRRLVLDVLNNQSKSGEL